MFLLAGNAQARGVYLDGYGIFFDVAVPMLRQSMMWSLRMMLQQDEARRTLAELRRYVQTETNPPPGGARVGIARLEAQAAVLQWSGGRGAVPAEGGVVHVTAARTPCRLPAGPLLSGAGPLVMDTNRRYTEEVQRALLDAMIDFSAPMTIGNDEWLTVAARDNERRDSLAPQDPYEEVVTVLLRIKGADLKEYRAGRIDKEEARKRVRLGREH
jgi:hypothetical protein